MDPFSVASLGMGLVGGIGKLFGIGGSNRKLKQLLKSDPQYKANPLAAQQLGMAQTLLNARMPGAAQAERNIYGNQAGQVAQINRNATDASQALSLISGTQGQTNEAFQNLGMAEAQDYQRRYGNLSQATGMQIAEQDKEFQDKVRRWQDAAQIQGAIQQNNQNAWGSVSNMGFGLMDFGLSGGFKNLFGGGSGGPSAGRTTSIPTSGLFG